MQKSSGKGPFYDVERVISKRSRKGTVSCFDLSDLSLLDSGSRLITLKSVIYHIGGISCEVEGIWLSFKHLGARGKPQFVGIEVRTVF